MNAKTFEEYDNLKVLIFLVGEWDEETDSNISVINDANLGEIMIFGAFVVIQEYKLILDRNFMLMIKDTWLARFNTLLSSYHILSRQDTKLPHDTVFDIITMYKIDEMILKVGNPGYSGIKLLEPMCVLRLSQIAHSYRPKFPIFASFPNHMNKSINEDPHLTPYLRQWETVLNKINSPCEIIAIYGGFRHWGHHYIDYMTGLEMLNILI